MKKWQVINWFLAALLLAGLVYLVDPSQMWVTLSSIAPIVLLQVALASVASLLLAALGVHLLLGSIQEIPFTTTLWAFLKSWSLGLVGLGKFGEASLIYFLKGKIAMGKVAAVVLVDKMITLVTLVALAASGTMMFSGVQSSIGLVSAGIFSCILVWLLITTPSIGNLCKRLLGKWGDSLQGFSKTARFISKDYGRLSLNFFLTIIRWFINAVILSLLFGSSSPAIIFVLMADALITLIGLLPISVNGIGTKEATAIFLFGQLGVEGAVVLSVFLLRRVINYSIAIVVAFFHLVCSSWLDKYYTSA
jgi:glycosyltransferase 2 family protein